MAAVYTNVQDVVHGATAITNVKSLSLDESIEHLLILSDGARGDSVVGDTNHTITGSIEVEETSVNTGGLLGFANVADLVFKVQLDSNAGTLKTYTITNVVFSTNGFQSSQSDPNTATLAFRVSTPDESVSVV